MTPEPRPSPNAIPLPAGVPAALSWAIEAAQSKKALRVTLLDLHDLGTFTDAFLLCSGASTRQVQAITEAVEEALGRRGMRLWHREGYDTAEWVLLDYGSCIVHIFHERAREFYDLERLWRSARRADIPDFNPTGKAQE